MLHCRKSLLATSAMSCCLALASVGCSSSGDTVSENATDTEGEGTVGPYCLDSITTPRNEAGFGVYDGNTTPGFQPLVDAAIAMDADGYDIVNEDGTINVSDLTSRGEQGLSYYLEAPFDLTLELTFLIPI